MNDIVRVIGVPAHEDRRGLFGDPLAAAFGSVPPAVCQPYPVAIMDRIGLDSHEREKRGTWHRRNLSLGFVPQLDALPLWWDGACVTAAWDLARRRLFDLGFGSPTVQLFNPTVDDVIHVANLLVDHGVLSRVVRLTRDRRSQLVEVTP